MRKNAAPTCQVKWLSILRGRKCKITNEEDEIEESDDGDAMVSSNVFLNGKYNKQKPTEIFKLLHIGFNTTELPKGGLTDINLKDIIICSFYHTNHIVVAMKRAVCELAITFNTHLMSTMIINKVNFDTSLSKYTRVISDVIFLGNRKVQIITQRIFSILFKRIFLHSVMNK